MKQGFGLLLALFVCQLEAAQQENLINGEMISPDFPYESRYVQVLGARMHYVD